MSSNQTKVFCKVALTPIAALTLAVLLVALIVPEVCKHMAREDSPAKRLPNLRRTA